MSEVSPLLQAVYRGDDDAVEALLADGPELDVFEAAAVGDVERLRELLDEDSSLAGAWSPDGAGALHLAAYYGRADADASTDDGRTPRSIWPQLERLE